VLQQHQIRVVFRFSFAHVAFPPHLDDVLTIAHDSSCASAGSKRGRLWRNEQMQRALVWYAPIRESARPFVINRNMSGQRLSACVRTDGEGKVNVTFEFCRSLYSPLATTRSPSIGPDVMMVRPGTGAAAAFTRSWVQRHKDSHAISECRDRERPNPLWAGPCEACLARDAGVGLPGTATVASLVEQQHNKVDDLD
jgi:hypothetical protein